MAIGRGIFRRFFAFACIVLPVFAIEVEDLLPNGNTGGDDADIFVTNGEPATISLSLPVVLYGKKYNTAYISQDGIVTFTQPLSQFDAKKFPLPYPAVAPYYADIDTDENGLVSARETKNEALLNKVNGWIQQFYPAHRDFQARALLIATWSEVPAVGQPSGWQNTFQLVIANSGEDSFAFFMYPASSLYWSKSGQAESFAQAGFVSDDGRYFALEGSGSDYIRGIGRIGRPEGAAPEGVLVYRIGTVEETAKPAEEDDQTNRWEEETAGELDSRHPLDPTVFRPQAPSSQDQEGGEEDHGEADREDDRYPQAPATTPGPNLEQRGNPVCSDMSECHSSATCETMNGGSCCKCGGNMLGNGKVCLERANPIQMNGEISGNLNGVEIPPAMIHNYIITEEGRSYVAFSPIPTEVGEALQTLIPLATSISWMFGLADEGLVNGLTLTGGVANYSATVQFTESGNTARITVAFLGFDDNKMLQSKIYVNGRTPAVNAGDSTSFNDFHIDYRRSSPGSVQAFYRGSVSVAERPVAFSVEESISFLECPYSASPLEGKTVRLHSSSIQSLFQTKEKASRFSINSKISPPGSEAVDNCANVDCGPNASCVPGDGDSTQCICRAGYQVRDGSDANAKPLDCVDVDECSVRNECSPNAECVNTEGSFQCRCLTGYVGDGRLCRTHEDVYRGDGEEDCNQKPEICSPNAQCRAGPQGRGECVCFPGYVGDGRDCQQQGPETPAQPVIAPNSCYYDPRRCDRHAACVPHPKQNGQFLCQCLPEYDGDGFTCREKSASQGGFLAFNQGMSVVRLPFDPNSQERGHPVSIITGQTAVGIAVDCDKSQLYWSDIAGNTINRARFDGTELDVVLRETQSAEGLAIDHVAGNIFWTDSANDQISVAKLSDIKSGSKVIVKDNLSNPRAIAVHPGRGTIYWTDWNRVSPKIETANMDGSDRKALITIDLGLPNALTIDFLTDDLCWADAGNQKIECSSLDGQNRRLVYAGNTYPFGITIHSQTIYWTDWTQNTVMSVQKQGGVARAHELPVGSSGKVYGIVAVPQECPRVQNACAGQNGGCQFLCLPLPGGQRTCACPDNISSDQCR